MSSDDAPHPHADPPAGSNQQAWGPLSAELRARLWCFGDEGVVAPFSTCCNPLSAHGRRSATHGPRWGVRCSLQAPSHQTACADERRCSPHFTDGDSSQKGQATRSRTPISTPSCPCVTCHHLAFLFGTWDPVGGPSLRADTARRRFEKAKTCHVLFHEDTHGPKEARVSAVI